MSEDAPKTPITDALTLARPALMEMWRTHKKQIEDHVGSTDPTPAHAIACGGHVAYLSRLRDDCPPPLKELNDHHAGLVGAAVLLSLREPLALDPEQDGNAMAVIADVRKQMRRAGWPAALADAFSEEARAGDYDHLLKIALAWTTDPLDP